MPASADRAPSSPRPPVQSGAGSVRRDATPGEARQLRQQAIVAGYIRDGMSEATARKLAAHETGG